MLFIGHCLVLALSSPAARTARPLAAAGPRSAAMPRIAATPRIAAAPRASASEENGEDLAEYPWRFDGRVFFRPALVRSPQPEALPRGVGVVSILGWTLGGVVALEYDESPVGPYREYVTMGALVTKRGAVGQWGSRLYVSTTAAEEVCERVWGVPAEPCAIDFSTTGLLAVEPPSSTAAAAGPAAARVAGWQATRHAAAGAARRGALPVLWTPTLKALWAPLVPLPPLAGAGAPLGLHRLRLSASSVRLHLCGQPPSDALGVPLPVGLSVDGLRIEIGRQLPGGAL